MRRAAWRRPDTTGRPTTGVRAHGAAVHATRRLACLAVTWCAAALLLAPAAPARSPATEVLVAISIADAVTLKALAPIAECRKPRKRACLRRNGAPVVRAAGKARRIVRAATRAAPRNSCARRAGRGYLHALGALRAGGAALAGGRLQQARRLLVSAADGQFAAARAAAACVAREGPRVSLGQAAHAG